MVNAVVLEQCKTMILAIFGCSPLYSYLSHYQSFHDLTNEEFFLLIDDYFNTTFNGNYGKKIRNGFNDRSVNMDNWWHLNRYLTAFQEAILQISPLVLHLEQFRTAEKLSHFYIYSCNRFIKECVPVTTQNRIILNMENLCKGMNKTDDDKHAITKYLQLFLPKELETGKLIPHNDQALSRRIYHSRMVVPDDIFSRLKYQPRMPMYTSLVIEWKNLDALNVMYVFDDLKYGLLHSLARHQMISVLGLGDWSRLSKYCRKMLKDIEDVVHPDHDGKPHYGEVQAYFKTLCSIPDRIVLAEFQMSLLQWIQNNLKQFVFDQTLSTPDPERHVFVINRHRYRMIIKEREGNAQFHTFYQEK